MMKEGGSNYVKFPMELYIESDLFVLCEKVERLTKVPVATTINAAIKDFSKKLGTILSFRHVLPKKSRNLDHITTLFVLETCHH